MSHFFRRRAIWLPRLAIVAVALSAYPDAGLSAAPGSRLLGYWQVESVRVDKQATRKMYVTEDDQRFVGRFLHFGLNEITFLTPDGEAKCGTPSVSTATVTAGGLVAQTMGGRGFAPETPVPRDYGLPFAPDDHIKAIWLTCGVGLLGPGLGSRNETWFVDLPAHHLAMGFSDSTVLILGQVLAGATPKASFPCAKSRTSTEKAICSSANLASFDRSISNSYADDLQQFQDVPDSDATSKLKKSQQDWLRIRNQCGGDGGCLLKTMSARLEALADTSTFTGD